MGKEHNSLKGNEMKESLNNDNFWWRFM